MHVQSVQKRELKLPLSPFAAASSTESAAGSQSPETAAGQKGSTKPPLAGLAGLFASPMHLPREQYGHF